MSVFRMDHLTGYNITGFLGFYFKNQGIGKLGLLSDNPIILWLRRQYQEMRDVPWSLIARWSPLGIGIRASRL